MLPKKLVVLMVNLWARQSDSGNGILSVLVVLQFTSRNLYYVLVASESMACCM